ncbi:MAG: sigma-70 family RNA polymerase sigma factor [Planctomycetota bacterium]
MPPHAERDLQRLLAEEPFVRDLARQLVASDADEVVQRTWLHAVQQGGAGVGRPRHWLARILRTVASNLRRDDRRRVARELATPPPELVPSSAALAEREESRRALVAAVDALPAPLRTVVLLRWFDGQPPRRIAKALGVPAATVSTQLQRALALLRHRLDAGHGGDRRAWLVPLIPFAVRPELPLAPPVLPVGAAPAAPALLLGAIAMTTKTKFAAATVALLMAAGAWMLSLEPGKAVTTPPDGNRLDSSALVQAPLGERAGAPPPATDAPAREPATPVPPAPTTGTVIVHVRYGDDHAPAPGVILALRPRGTDGRYQGWRQRTDTSGTVRYDDAAPGDLHVGTVLGLNEGKRVDLAAGQTVEVELDLEVGITVTGVVLDASRVPVAGAQVEMAHVAHSGTLPEVVAVSDAGGRFSARACPDLCLVGARAAGHLASPVRFLHGKKGNTAEVELVLGRDGGAIDGIVVDTAGNPIANAVVIAGQGEVSGIDAYDNGPAFPALTRSGADGRFLAIGVPTGEQPLRVRAPTFAPWRGKCEVAAGAAVVARIVLLAGGAMRGSVRDAEGKPVDRAELRIGNFEDLAQYRQVTGIDGSFSFTGLPIGELHVFCSHKDLGKAAQNVVTNPGGVATCDLQLSRGLELKGNVVDSDGQPVASAILECLAEPRAAGSWSRFAETNAQGRFVIANCPESGTISIRVTARGFEELRQRGVDPRTPELRLQLQRAVPRTVRIVGRVVRPDGRPAANASVTARRREPRSSSGLDATDNDGRFELGPVAPGAWSVNVTSPDHPVFVSNPRELAADATWDLGTITLVIGGTARVRLVGPAIDGTMLSASDAARTYGWAVDADGDSYRTSALAPGDYVLLVSGRATAATAVPFTIRASEETTMDVQPQLGVVQRFVCDLPAGANAEGVALLVFRGDAFVGRTWANPNDGEIRGELSFAAGDYTVRAEAGALRGSATFTVGAVSGPPVRLALR